MDGEIRAFGRDRGPSGRSLSLCNQGAFLHNDGVIACFMEVIAMLLINTAIE
jgi:hypothetical protein